MMGIESDIARSSNSRVIDFDTVIRKCLIKQEQILNKVNSPVKPSLKNELLMCGWVKVVPRVARWLSPKYRTLIVPMSVAQNIKLLTHALSGISLVVVGRNLVVGWGMLHRLRGWPPLGITISFKMDKNTGQSGSILDTWQLYLCLNRFSKLRLNTFIKTTS